MKIKEMNKIKEYLLRQQEKIVIDIKQMEIELTTPMNQSEDDALIFENNSNISNVLRVEKHKLKLIKNALIKMENGTYGECSSCGEAIEKNRIKAIPYSSLCILCKEGQEQR